MQGKVKKKNVKVVRASQALTLLTYVLLGSAVIIALPLGCVSDMMQESLHDKCEDIRNSQAFEEYVQYKKNMYDDMVQDGFITEEIAEKNKDIIESDDHIVANINTIDESLAKDIDTLDKNVRQCRDASFGIVATNVSLGLASAVPALLLALSQKGKQDENEYKK